MSFADWQSGATPERHTVEVCFDRQAVNDLEEALRQFGAVRQAAAGLLDTPASVNELVDRIQVLEELVAESSKTMVFGKIPQHRWSDLEAACPATDEQKERDPNVTLNDLEFEPAIVAECCIEPGLEIEQAVWLRDFLPRDRWEDVLAAVWRANRKGSLVPKVASGIAGSLRSALKSITPPDEESPSPSSEDES